MWKCSFCVHRNVLRRSLPLGNLNFTTFFIHWSKIFQPTVIFFFVCVVKNAVCLYRRTFRIRKKWKLCNFSYFLVFELIFPRFFSRICRWCCQNRIPHPQRNALLKKTFLRKNHFLSLSHIEGKKDWILSKRFSHECQNCIQRVASNFLRRRIIVEILFFKLWLSTISELFSALWRKTLGRGIQNCKLHIHRKFLRKILFFSSKENFFFPSRTFSEVHQSSGNFFSWVVNTAFYISEKIFWGEGFVWEFNVFPFPDKDRKFSSQLPKKFQRSCQNHLKHLQTELQRKKCFFFGKKQLILSLWDIEQKNSGFSQNFSGKKVKIAFYVSLEKFWGESCLWNDFFSLFPSDFEQTFFVSLLKNFWTWQSERQSACL